MSIKQVIVLRKDLGMRKGKMAAQAAHASMAVLIKSGGKPFLDQDACDWLGSGMTKVVVGCDSEEELRDIYQSAKASGVQCSFIVDAGRTEFHGVPTPTAVAVGPAEEEKVDRITGHLKLL